jgi:hypothetical protein
LSLAAIQRGSVMSVVPLLQGNGSGPFYVTMKEAMGSGSLIISEISSGGSVPQLMAKNEGKDAILLLDGEEMKGAKQNRVLNTTVLVPPLSEITIPVSCTEAGRWRYTSDRFHESGNVLPSRMRATKSERVSDNLSARGTYDGGQGAVWDEIVLFQRTNEVHSGTSAMEDVYVQQRESLQEITAPFVLLEGQCGVLVRFNGRFIGMDVLSRPDAWKDVHQKIIHSYAVDARHLRPNPDQICEEGIDYLLERVPECKITTRRSVGLGNDMRVQGNGITGACLHWEEAFVHTAIYAAPERENPSFRERYDSPRHRR